MFSTSFSRLFTLCSALVSLGASYAAPAGRCAPKAPSGPVPTGPKFVVYTDAAISGSVLPPLDQITGFNVV